MKTDLTDGQAIALIRERRGLYAEMTEMFEQGTARQDNPAFKTAFERMLEINRLLDAAGCFDNRDLYDAK